MESIGSTGDESILLEMLMLLHSDGNVDVLFVSYLEKFYLCWHNY